MFEAVNRHISNQLNGAVNVGTKNFSCSAALCKLEAILAVPHSSFLKRI